MAIVVKSGTNQIHGSLFEFNRGTVDGPIRRNKTFFFMNYEEQLLETAAQGLYSVPSAASK